MGCQDTSREKQAARGTRAPLSRSERRRYGWVASVLITLRVMFSLSRSERSTQNPEVIFAANLVMEVPSPETLPGSSVGTRQAGWDECLQGIEIKRLAHKRELAEKEQRLRKDLRSNAQSVLPRGGGDRDTGESVSQSACAKIKSNQSPAKWGICGMAVPAAKDVVDQGCRRDACTTKLAVPNP